MEGADRARERHGDIPSHHRIAIARPVAQGAQGFVGIDAKQGVADRVWTEIATHICLFGVQQRRQQIEKIGDPFRLVTAGGVFDCDHHRSSQVLRFRVAKDLEPPAHAIEITVEEGAEQATGGFADFPVRVFRENFGGAEDALAVSAVTADQKQAGHLTPGGRGRGHQGVDPTGDPTALFRKCRGQPLTNLLTQGRRTSGPAVMELAIERGDHAGRVVTSQRGEHHRDRPFFHAADGVRADGEVHVRTTSIRCSASTAPPL